MAEPESTSRPPALRHGLATDGERRGPDRSKRGWNRFCEAPGSATRHGRHSSAERPQNGLRWLRSDCGNCVVMAYVLAVTSPLMPRESSRRCRLGLAMAGLATRGPRPPDHHRPSLRALRPTPFRERFPLGWCKRWCKPILVVGVSCCESSVRTLACEVGVIRCAAA